MGPRLRAAAVAALLRARERRSEEAGHSHGEGAVLSRYHAERFLEDDEELGVHGITLWHTSREIFWPEVVAAHLPLQP